MTPEIRGADAGDQSAYRWKLDSAEFDEGAWELRVDGRAVDIERRPLDVLAFLLRHAGEVVTKDELLDAAWSGRVVVEGALTNAIGKLRRALGGEEQQLIATVPRVGYRFVGKVERKVVQRRVLAAQLHAGDAVPRRPNWRLERRLDEGDHGEVWQATQIKTHESRVFKFSFDGSRLPSLKREVTIARLLHDSLGERPDFVAISDWDFEDAPYFIESDFGGPNLEEFSSAQGGLSTIALEKRLDYLAEVADALAAAHDLGVLHKDLKPANLLVRGEPADFHPRIVDFGSGKLLEPERLDALGISQLGFTQTQNLKSGSLTGTPLYLAPELIAGQVPTVRSDIYALGVMLFQLCVGDLRRPLSAGWESEIADPLLREDIAAAANGNPEMRFMSARELAQRLRTRDERRQQRDAELEAKARIAQAERALAATRARRPWVIAAIAMLVAGLGVSLYLYRDARGAEHKANSALQTSQTLNKFVVLDLLGSADPYRAGHAGTTVIEAIDHAMKTLPERFADQPQAEADILLMIGEVDDRLDRREAAASNYAMAAQLLERLHGKDDADALKARVQQVNALNFLGRTDEAQKLLDEALPRIDANSGISAMLRIRAFNAQSNIAVVRGDWSAAADASGKVYAAAIAAPGLPPLVRVRSASIAANAYARVARFKEADLAINDAIKTSIAAYGEKHPETINARILQAGCLVMAGRPNDALAILGPLDETVVSVLGKDSEAAADVQNTYGDVYIQLRRFPEAIAAYMKAETYREKASGIGNPLTVELMLSLAEAQRLNADPKAALATLRRAMEKGVAALPVDSPSRDKLAAIYAASLIDIGDFVAAAKAVSSIRDKLLVNSDPSANWADRLHLLRGELAIHTDDVEARSELQDAVNGFTQNNVYHDEAVRNLKTLKSATAGSSNESASPR